MPLTMSGALESHLAQDTATLCFVFKLTYTHPIDGTVSIGLTTFDKDLVVDGVSYQAVNGVTPSSLVSQLGLVADKFDLIGALSDDGISEADIHSGLYDFADISVYLVNWYDTTMFALWGKYKVAEMAINGREWIMECADIADQFRQNIVELTSPACRVDLFSARCKVRNSLSAWAATTAYTLSHASDANVGSWVLPSIQNRRWFRCSTAGTSGGSEPSWNTTVGGTTSDGSVVWTTINAFVLSGSVTSKTSNQVFADSTITEASQFWRFGKIVWTSGANQGYSMEIKDQTSTVLTLYFPMINTVAVGDAFTLYAGCDKSKTACKDKFGNVYNMQAEPDKPSRKIMSKFGAP